ncbi:hypothetical protein EUA06_15110 [Nocardioides glacieisoli]|uniref:Uncharacterized protein n=1 Tax=Nocardioides glacieisoli TaxID=1168730 RepID=A0A4Q2RKU9_9ACTN|nr:hypothetical protein [Nocardioides glacieisoli]RYB89317.1 hypothetical protein EUA06_15110 [Nocardioides glacieisoli]
MTTAKGTQAWHVNAVELEAADDAQAHAAVSSLTRCTAVLVTDGSHLDGMPVEGTPLTVSDIEDLVTATEAQRDAILLAVKDFKRTTRSASVKLPTFPASPKAADFVADEDTATGRAFTTANFLAKAWTAWLRTDEERRRRTARPKTGETPWIMPHSMSSPQVDLFPEAFVPRVHEQPLV